MKQGSIDLKLLWGSILLSLYFLMLFLLWHFQIRTTIIGVFQELLTLPLIAMQLVLVVWTGKGLLKNKGRSSRTFVAFIISLVTTILILQSF